MSEAKDIVELFKRADQMIVDYLHMMDNFERYIRARVERGTPLPQGVTVALHHGVENDVVWLTRALRDFEEDKRVVAGHLGQIRRSLANAKTTRNIGQAEILLSDWPNNVERSMETVINTAYEQSDILPPPPIYWNSVENDYYRYFRHEPGSPQDVAQSNSVIHYLNTIENPWSRYVDRAQ